MACGGHPSISFNAVLLEHDAHLNLLDALLGQSEDLGETVPIRSYLGKSVHHHGLKGDVMLHQLLHDGEHPIQ